MGLCWAGTGQRTEAGGWGLPRNSCSIGRPVRCRDWRVMPGFPGRASLLKLLEVMVRIFSYFITV